MCMSSSKRRRALGREADTSGVIHVVLVTVWGTLFDASRASEQGHSGRGT